MFEALTTKSVIEKSMKFVLEWREFVCRVIDDWNEKVIYIRRKTHGLEVFVINDYISCFTNVCFISYTS